MIARQSALGLGFLCNALPNRLSHLKLCIAELIEQLLSHQMVGYRLGLLGGADAEATNRRRVRWLLRLAWDGAWAARR